LDNGGILLKEIMAKEGVFKPKNGHAKPKKIRS
jgi:hypothetical protein